MNIWPFRKSGCGSCMSASEAWDLLELRLKAATTVKARIDAEFAYDRSQGDVTSVNRLIGVLAREIDALRAEINTLKEHG